jgi:hypothetical protein
MDAKSGEELSATEEAIHAALPLSTEDVEKLKNLCESLSVLLTPEQNRQLELLAGNVAQIKKTCAHQVVNPENIQKINTVLSSLNAYLRDGEVVQRWADRSTSVLSAVKTTERLAQPDWDKTSLHAVISAGNNMARMAENISSFFQSSHIVMRSLRESLLALSQDLFSVVSCLRWMQQDSFLVKRPLLKRLMERRFNAWCVDAALGILAGNPQKQIGSLITDENVAALLDSDEQALCMALCIRQYVQATRKNPTEEALKAFRKEMLSLNQPSRLPCILAFIGMLMAGYVWGFIPLVKILSVMATLLLLVMVGRMHFQKTSGMSWKNLQWLLSVKNLAYGAVITLGVLLGFAGIPLLGIFAMSAAMAMMMDNYLRYMVANRIQYVTISGKEAHYFRNNKGYHRGQSSVTSWPTYLVSCVSGGSNDPKPYYAGWGEGVAQEAVRRARL